MPLKKQYRKKRAAPKRRQAPRRRMAKRSGNVAEYASLSVKRSYTTGESNQLYSLMNTQLSQFQRAVQVAKAYQFYRIKRIAMTFKPQMDTFANNTGIGYTKPYLYYMIDKSGSLQSNVTLETLKQMGARPKVLDEKPVIVSWTPSVLDFAATNVAAAQGFPNKYMLSPWLTTNERGLTTTWNASEVDHLGIYYIAVSALIGGSPPTVKYDVEIEVQFEFKKPLIQNPETAPVAISIQPLQLNDSSDGVVGGPDGI